MRAHVLRLGALSGALSITTSAQAAPSAAAVPVSELPVASAFTPLTPLKEGEALNGLKVEQKSGHRGSTYLSLEAAAKRGFCLVDKRFGLQVEDDTSVYDTTRQDYELARIVEKDGEATFERTRFWVEGQSPTPGIEGRSWVRLSALVRGPKGTLVWGFRSGREVFVVARSATSGIEPRVEGDSDRATGFVSASEVCRFGIVRLDTSRAKEGVAARLNGPFDSKSGRPKFVVDASLVRLSRDPEPKLSVRFRSLVD